MLLLAVVAAFGPPATATMGSGSDTGADGDLVKVFVVQNPAATGGGSATLASIAAVTLGDQGRAEGIFTLNKGLPQKDGEALDDPGENLHPGWILRLPPDASGPEVQLARDTASQGQQSQSAGGGVGRPAGQGLAQDKPGTRTVVTVPLAAVLAVVGTIVLLWRPQRSSVDAPSETAGEPWTRAEGTRWRRTFTAAAPAVKHLRFRSPRPPRDMRRAW